EGICVALDKQFDEMDWLVRLDRGDTNDLRSCGHGPSRPTSEYNSHCIAGCLADDRQRPIFSSFCAIVTIVPPTTVPTKSVVTSVARFPNVVSDASTRITNALKAKML